MLANLLIFSVLSAAPVAPTVSPDDVPAAAPVYAGVTVATHDNNVSSSSSDMPAPKPTKSPLVSINTDVLDMSWTGAMDLADPEILRPTGIVLPFLESHPIDNFEVKLHLLNLRF